MATSATTQRLLHELKGYTKSPNEALLHLGPVDEDDLLHWEAVLKGVKGTPYEGIPHSPNPNPCASPTLRYKRNTNIKAHRRPLVPQHHASSELPPKPTEHPLPHAHLPPERILHDGRDLSHAVDL